MALPSTSSTWEQVSMSRKSQPIPSMFVAPQLFFIEQDSHTSLKESDWGRNSRLACIYCLEKGSSCYCLTGERYTSKFTSC